MKKNCHSKLTSLKFNKNMGLKEINGNFQEFFLKIDPGIYLKGAKRYPFATMSLEKFLLDDRTDSKVIL